MSVLIFAEHEENKFKKSSFEAISYGKTIAEKIGSECIAVAIACSNNEAINNLSEYGADKIVNITNQSLTVFDSTSYAAAVAEVANKFGSSVIVISNTYSGKAMAPRIAARLKASIATGVISLPETNGGFVVRRSCYSNKAFAEVNLTAAIKVLSLVPNSFDIKETKTTATAENISVGEIASQTAVQSVSKEKGKIPLTEAEIVVSGGRGLKGPENWGMVEELAELLHAATACSKPVSDMDWRPHSEHVGQTGITIKPNLYIAIGISGAIQHLAGVGSSKVICVINKDPEAPFFKAADFGIIGDAFEVVPKLIARAKELQLS